MIAVYVVSALAGAALLGTAVYHKNTISNLPKIGPNTVRAGLNIEKEKLKLSKFREAYHPDKHSSAASTGLSRSHSNISHSAHNHSNSRSTGSTGPPMARGGKNTKRRYKRRYKK